jgi:hypothetical protein
MSTKKVKTYTCKSCGKTSEKIGVTSFCRQTLNVDSGDYSSPEVGEALHGFCLECSAEVPANILKKFLKGGEISVDHQSLLLALVNSVDTEGIARPTVSLEALNKARVALGYKREEKPMTEKELDKRIDKAPEQKVRQCLKIIASLWFVENGKASFDKPVSGDIIEAVTGELHRFGFSPKEK